MLERAKQPHPTYATNSGVNDYIYVCTLNHVTGTNQVKARNYKRHLHALQ